MSHVMLSGDLKFARLRSPIWSSTNLVVSVIIPLN